MSRITVENFQPPRWLRGGHRQSILVGLPLRRRAIERRSLTLRISAREWIVDAGAGVRLQAWHSSPSARGRARGAKVAVLLHGWEGSADSLYILSLGQALFDAGYEVVRLNLRDHGATHHLNEELFHSCRLPEVLGAVAAIQRGLDGKPLYLAGFSLGGNFMLRVAAQAARAGLRVAKTVAVSPVLDPARTLDYMEAGLRIYQTYFVLKWTRSLLKKQAAWPDRYDFAGMLRERNLRKMTEAMVLAHTDYATLAEYLAGYALTGERLATLDSPATVFTARDDPIIPAVDLDRLSFAGPLRVRLSQRGGHCAYLQDLTGPSWLDAQVIEEFATA